MGKLPMWSCMGRWGRVERMELTWRTGEQRHKKGPQRMPTVTLAARCTVYYTNTCVASLCSDMSHVSIYVTAFAVCGYQTKLVITGLRISTQPAWCVFMLTPSLVLTTDLSKQTNKQKTKKTKNWPVCGSLLATKSPKKVRASNTYGLQPSALPERA